MVDSGSDERHGTVRREEMNFQVDRELAVIPRGDLGQNTLRMSYTMWRRNSLGPKPEIECSAAAAYAAAVAGVGRDRPEFVPLELTGPWPPRPAGVAVTGQVAVAASQGRWSMSESVPSDPGVMVLSGSYHPGGGQRRDR
jgi:hypothetical protein